MRYCEFCGREFDNNITFYEVLLPVKDNSGDIPIVNFNICYHCYYNIGQAIESLRSKMAQYGTPESITYLKNRKPTSRADRELTQSIINNFKYRERYGVSITCGDTTYTIFTSSCLKDDDYKISEETRIILVNSYVRQNRQDYYWQRLIFNLVKELHKRNNIYNYEKLFSDYTHILACL